MKYIKNLLTVFLVLNFLFFFVSSVFASNTKTTLTVVQNASETKYLENDQGYLSKSIINSDPNNGEVTVELKLSNMSKNTTTQTYDTTEIFIITPESYNDKKQEEYNKRLDFIETLSQKILAKNSKTKIGIIGMKGPIADNYLDENGILHSTENDQSDVEGSEKDSECIVNLTSDFSQLKTGLRKMNPEKIGYYSNFQSALRLANNSFSKQVNKILISLFDNVPSTSIGVSSSYSYGGLFSPYKTAEEAARAHLNSLVSTTKSEILALKENNVDFILLRPDNTDFDQKFYNSNTGVLNVEIDGTPFANELYGTLESPTYGKMYSLNNDNLEKIVTEYIYEDVIHKIHTPISSIKLVDYFPKEIVDNFEFSYVEKPSIGDVSDIIDTKTNTITWNINTLNAQETARLSYKLKLKNMQNTSLLNKTIATNEKVVLSYMDSESKNFTITLDSSPKIQLSEIKEQIQNSTDTNKKDPTMATGKLPFAGMNPIILFSIAIILLISIFIWIKLKFYKDVK